MADEDGGNAIIMDDEPLFGDDADALMDVSSNATVVCGMCRRAFVRPCTSQAALHSLFCRSALRL